MEIVALVIGVIGNIISVLMFLSPVGTFIRIVKNQSTEEFDSLPYICTLLSSSLWTYYGIIKPGSFLVSTTNGFGVAVEIIYVSLFLLFAPPKMRLKTAVLVVVLNVVFSATAILLAHFGSHGEMRIDVIGFLCSALNIVMYSSPLSVVKTVVTTKSVEYMPFLLSLFFFLNGGVWTLYALLVRDWFLGVPNGIGCLLGTAQLVIYAIYRKGKSVKHTADLEEGGQIEHLLPPSATTNIGE
ncbi:bidirectional sugar transporter SWEET17-like isoform X1 [Nicotiana tabacum]|uniref:Bidirectional sugar transporter SWEET n=1 Tax=Nicotiana tabacum TaxID=4097 RepID=A0A1S4DJG6_TOBAC|nr:PREDICTED: bidirectional sugar transporter SWEET17-like isoform X1 [Nicotiana tabacum]